MIKLNSLRPSIPPEFTALNVPTIDVRVAVMLSGVSPMISTALLVFVKTPVAAAVTAALLP